MKSKGSTNVTEYPKCALCAKQLTHKTKAFQSLTEEPKRKAICHKCDWLRKNDPDTFDSKMAKVEGKKKK